jgi:predicted enzyme related to lactoylglutathione lyase
MVSFTPDGSGLILLAVNPEQKREVELCFESDDVAAAVERLRARGVQFTDELRRLSFGSVIHFRDPEDNLLSLLQPGTAVQTTSGRSASGGAALEAKRGATAGVAVAVEAARGSSTTPRLSTAVVNVRDLAKARSYYAHLLGLHQSVESPIWAQFDTGDIQLALHSRRDRSTVELHLEQPVGFGFSVDNLEAWVDEAEARGVKLASAPVDDGLGLTAEVLDPEGNGIAVREPMSEESLEEKLAEAFEEEVPARTSMRKTVLKAVPHASWVVNKPDYKPSKTDKAAETANEEERELRRAERIKQIPSQRGTGPVRSREKPKRINDPERVRARPAMGRLKKEESRILGTAKKEAARASKSKPVKRAASKTSTKRKPSRAAPRRGRAS